MTRINKQYLGDGVYAAFDGFGVWLTAENGISITHEIYLEPDMVAKIGPYLERSRTIAEQLWKNRTCNQKDCDAESAFMVVWPGDEPAGICVKHLPAMQSIAETMGIPSIATRPITSMDLGL